MENQITETAAEAVTAAMIESAKDYISAGNDLNTAMHHIDNALCALVNIGALKKIYYIVQAVTFAATRSKDAYLGDEYGKALAETVELNNTICCNLPSLQIVAGMLGDVYTTLEKMQQ